ncbi:hypothetical protein ACH5RR_013249 [Cinchona calisaya]|uniref:Uncharacterized protein n=1 Tax=Cinchona calisaya TaxID=153742 RepID=A0ABD2ZZM1_9GENT
MRETIVRILMILKVNTSMDLKQRISYLKMRDTVLNSLTGSELVDDMHPIDRIEVDVMLQNEMVNAVNGGDNGFIGNDMEEESTGDEDDEENTLANEDWLSS